MATSAKKIYQKNYYAAHPELKEKARARERQKRAHAVSVAPGRKYPSTYKLLQILPLLALCGLITSVLLREMSAVYAESGNQMMGWLKAIALEGSVIALSVYSFKQVSYRIISRGFVLLLCLFSVYAMSVKQVGEGLGSIRQNKLILEEMQATQGHISARSTERELLFSKGWISAARKIDSPLDELRLKLSSLRERLIQVKTENVSIHETLVQVAMRILLTIANVLIASCMGEMFETFKSPVKISKLKVETSNRVLKFQAPKKHAQSRIPGMFENLSGEWSRGYG